MHIWLQCMCFIRILLDSYISISYDIFILRIEYRQGEDNYRLDLNPFFQHMSSSQENLCSGLATRQDPDRSA